MAVRLTSGGSARRKPKPKAKRLKINVRKTRKSRARKPKRKTKLGGAPYDPQLIAEEYAEGVHTGKIVAGKLVRLAVKRYYLDLARKDSPWYFDVEKARKLCLFYPHCLPFTKGEQASYPFLPGENIESGDYEPGRISNFIPSPSQTFILWNLGGWRTKATGYRRYTQAYVSTGKKWGKSEFGAGLALYLGLRDDPPEPGARVVLCATKREQASDLTFRQAAQMVQTSPAFAEEARAFAYHIESGGATQQPFALIKPIGSNKNTSDGQDLSGAILDELHEWKRKQHRKFFGTITTAGGSRRQPLVAMITTAGDDQSDVWNEVEPQFINALEASVEGDYTNDHLFVYIARLDGDHPCDCLVGPLADPNCRRCKGMGTLPGDDIYDETKWIKANPNYPITPTLAYLRERAASAKMSNELRQDFRRYNCNLKSSSFNKAVSREMWNRCACPTLSDWEDGAEVIAGGIDLGERDDLCACTFCARLPLRPGHPLYNTFIEDKNERPRGTGGLYLPVGSDQTTEEAAAAIANNVQNLVDALTKPSPQESNGTKKQERYRYEVISYAWCPSDGAINVHSEPYATWIKAGQLKVVPGPVIDLATLMDEIIELGRYHKCKQFRADPRNALQFLQGLEKARFEAIEHIQQFYMYNEPIKEWLRVVRRGLFGYNPSDSLVLSWSINNLVLKRNARGELMPDRERSIDKIDPAVSLLMAFAEAYYAKARYMKGNKPYAGEAAGMWG
jgi:phage terminase large subunit-like protein